MINLIKDFRNFVKRNSLLLKLIVGNSYNKCYYVPNYDILPVHILYLGRNNIVMVWGQQKMDGSIHS